jgi:MarR family transcriptional regulator for hemolysin
MTKDKLRQGETGIRSDLVLRIFSVTRQLRKNFDHKASILGVTRSKWSMIAVVSSYPGASQKMIADILEISDASAGRAIDRLITEGMLKRTPRDDDRRAYHVHLTDKAQPLLDKLAVIAKDYEAETFAGMMASEIEQLHALLGRLSSNLTEPAATGKVAKP